MKRILILAIALTLLGSYHTYRDYREQPTYMERQEETQRCIREREQRPERRTPYQILIGEKPTL